MNEIRISSRALEMKVKGVRTLGRPQTRWLNQVVLHIDLKKRGHDWERIQEEELRQDRKDFVEEAMFGDDPQLSGNVY
ncbi:hypothetical protein ANN_13458 [Periplaneta americana]|uniref:Uncharacterized protein n=1 Tax=Periplaneta americana TaxID=6978 RepID=A0ABQ8TLG3_PERAM|nr:hypothetical protein ANN_13458 [Periplaneta americana]